MAQGKAEIFDGDLDDYSRWLIEQKKSPQSDQAADKNIAGKKEQRQQAAEQRKKIAPITNAIKKIEQQMAKTDQAIAIIETALAESSLYEETNKDKLQTLLQDQGKAKREKEQQEERWFELQDELENLQQ